MRLQNNVKSQNKTVSDQSSTIDYHFYAGLFKRNVNRSYLTLICSLPFKVNVFHYFTFNIRNSCKKEKLHVDHFSLLLNLLK